MPLISVIIPVKNGAFTIERCLQSLFSQTVAEQLEVIIIDSGSDDESLIILEKFPVKVVQIDPKCFNHGLTRNYGVSLADGELLYFTVQDAWIPEKDTLERMAAHFQDELVQGVVGMQATPSELDKNPAAWFKRASVPKIEERYFPNHSFAKLTKKQQFQLSNWDNVMAMYRKSALEDIPFRKTNFSEDWFWSHDALHSGMKLLRDPSSVNFHYHHKSFSYAFRVEYSMNYAFFSHFNVLPDVPDFFTLFSRSVYRILKISQLSLLKKIYWINHNFFSLAGFTLSNITFRLAHFVRKDSGLDFTYQFFCKQVPQGKSK